MDGKLQTVYSNGTTEVVADNVADRKDFFSKFKSAKEEVFLGLPTKPIFSKPNSNFKADFGNWVLSSSALGQIRIVNTENGGCKILIKSDLPGFTFETNQNNSQTFTAESMLGKVFNI